MRKLVVTRGPQGAGKTTFIRKIGLDGHLISADDLRRILASPVMMPDGAIQASHEQEQRVWSTLRQILDERMARGELIVVDATHRAARDFKAYGELARKHRYDVVCVDFAPIPLEAALKQNRERPSHLVVPENALRRTHEACRQGIVPDWVERIEWRDDGSHADRLNAWLGVPVYDLSSSRRVVHVGDLQGCAAPLIGRGGLLEDGFRDDSFYVFVGDLCDRGIENDKILRFMIDEAMDRPNVRILWGNHEDHLHRWATGQASVSPEFENYTLPQLVASDIRPEEVDRLCDRLQDCFLYAWRGRKVMVTHAGLSTVPEHPERISTYQYARGTGSYNDPVDRRFSETAPEGWVQVHGHRNSARAAIDAHARSFNLEDRVEFGGNLRALTLDERGFRGIEIRNTVFLPLAERLKREQHRQEPKIYPDWVRNMGSAPIMEAKDIESLRAHPLVYEKPSKAYPYIASFNFTRDAFYDAKWDDVNVRARGLFVNTETLEIVARSYDKFFNVDERPETTLNGLEKGLVFPVTAFAKENGYLGILGYDSWSGELFYASKSTPDGDYAQWFKEITEATVSNGALEDMRRYLRDVQATMAFEVIDPVRDPHIIEYDKPKIVLLDVIRRSRDFEKLPYDRLRSLGERFGLEVKDKAMTFGNWNELSGWMKAASKPDYLYKGKPIEGFVLEDARGFQAKLKLDHYRFWKHMRSVKDRVLTIRGTQKPLERNIEDPRARAFYEWCQTQPDAVLRRDIIQLRKSYESGRPIEVMEDEGRGAVPAKRRERADPAVRGFELALQSLAKKASEAGIKEETANKLLAAAVEDERKMSILERSEIRVDVVRAASHGEHRRVAAERLSIGLDEAASNRSKTNQTDKTAAPKRMEAVSR
jgi:predicted kinase